MRIVGYTRTRLIEELGEQDLEEQERGIAEFCNARDLQLSAIVVDEASNDSRGLLEVLDAPVDGIVVTDPLIIADDLDGICNFATKLLDRKMHLFMILNDRHIDPHTDNAQRELVEISSGLLQHASSKN